MFRYDVSPGSPASPETAVHTPSGSSKPLRAHTADLHLWQKQKRTQLRLSQIELADRAELTEATVNHIEQGHQGAHQYCPQARSGTGRQTKRACSEIIR